ncbi:MAG: DUF1836 domain-containing protein [Clostridiales Family XIII bacterium]|nr:DUF1836 domain-containing protein [Clostridiales Family XIII bacterium]
MRYEEYIKHVMDDFTSESIIKPDAFPTMELYADQVAGFFDEQLKIYAGAAREKSDSVLTETGIASSVKRGVLPKPIKKKYARDHVIIMTMLFYMTSVLRTDEIESVMRPFIDNYDSTFDDKIDFYRLYAAIAPVLERERTLLSREIQGSVTDVKAAIRGEGLEDDDNTELLLLLLSLAARADAAKYAVQRILSEYFTRPEGTRNKHGKPQSSHKARAKQKTGGKNVDDDEQ